MKVLFAVNNDNISDAIIKKYQKQYREIITHKNVYYFNAILKELQNDKTYDRVVISEDLEPFANNNYDTIDKFLFEKLDRISDEATKVNGDNIDIILVCSDRRNQSDDMLTRIFGIGIYNALIGEERNIDKLCELLNHPRTKKEAKMYYRITGSNVSYQAEDENNVSEAEVQNILAHYKRLGKDEDRSVDSFNNIVSQYTDAQLKIIIRYLPLNVKAVLEERSPKYQELANALNSNSRKSKTPYTPRTAKTVKKEEKINVKMLQNEKDNISKPIVIPSSLNNNKRIIIKPKDTENTKMTKVVPTLAEQAEQTLENSADDIENVVEDVEDVKDYMIDEVANNDIVEDITDSVKENIDEVDDTIGDIQDNVNDTIDDIQDNVNDTFDDIQDNVDEVIDENIGDTVLDTIDETISDGANVDIGENTEEIVAPKRGRGRPRKNPPTEESVEKVKRGRGRPKKIVPEEEKVEEKEEENNDEIDLFSLDDDNNELITNELQDNNTVQNDDEDDFDLFSLDDTEDVAEIKDEETENKEDEDAFDVFSLDEETDSNDKEEHEEFEDNEDIEEEKEDVEEDNDEDAFDLFSLEEEKTDSDNNEIEETENTEENEDTFNLFALNNEESEESEEEIEEDNNDSDFDIYDDDDDDDDSFDSSEDNSDEFDVEDDEIEEEPEFEIDYDETEQTNRHLLEEEKKEIISIKPTVNNEGLSSLLTKDKKIVVFVGTTKNGTSFIVNNLALTLSSMNISTAILDTTKTRNAYYIFTKNEQELRNIAENSISNLSNEEANGLEVNRNLTVYTELPGKSIDDINVEKVLSTLVQRHDIVLVDADFDTNLEFFDKAQEVFLVQSMDVLTIQPLTAFLRNLKSNNILKPEKLKIIINKWEKVKNLTDKILIGGISSYNDPAMSYMTDLFDKDKILYCKIPFEQQNYIKYLGTLVDCEISLKGYTKQFLTALKELASMVYPLVNQQTYSPMGNNKKAKMDFSDSTKNTLNKMKKNY